MSILGFSIQDIYNMTISEFNLWHYEATKTFKKQSDMIAYSVAVGMGNIKPQD